MTMPTPPGQLAWHVLGDEITQTTILRPGGTGLLDVYQVPYVIDSGPSAGHRGQVTIPIDRFNADSVRAAVSTAAAAVHDVGNVSG